jgi:hypothetical protein
MPTPESEAFLAKKPKVAPTFDGVDYDDNKALKAAQDAILREQWVKSMMARLVREEMGKCYRREGVNHLEKCGHLRGMSVFEFRWEEIWMWWCGFGMWMRGYWLSWVDICAGYGLTCNVQNDTLSCSRMRRSRDTYLLSITISRSRNGCLDLSTNRGERLKAVNERHQASGQALYIHPSRTPALRNHDFSIQNIQPAAVGSLVHC